MCPRLLTPKTIVMAVLSRLERNRDLIEKSAALLAADYPVGILVERLCATISTALGSTCAVVIPSADGTAEITSADDGSRLPSRREALNEDSPVARVLATGRPLFIRNPNDWDGDSELDAGAAIYVPVQHAKRVLGVLCVLSGAADQYDRDDQRALEAVARYLAMAMRSQSVGAVAAVPARYPWFAVATVAAAALILSIVVGIWAGNRATAAYARAAQAQQNDLARIESQLAPVLLSGERITRVAAGVVAPIENDRRTTNELLTRLLQSSPKDIYGIGVFYEANAYDPTSTLYGSYYHRNKGSPGVLSAIHIASDYPIRIWYRLAVRAGGSVAFSDPYVGQGQGFVSASTAVYDGRHLRGVAMIDFLSDSLSSVLRKAVSAGQYAYVTNARGRAILASGPSFAGETNTVSIGLAPATWTLHLTERKDLLVAESRQIIVWGVGLVLFIWAVGLAIFGFLNVVHHARRDALGLKLERAELQSEITSRLEAEERLREAAYYDPLTGLPNRSFFLDQLAEVLDNSPRGEYGVLFIDLDRFYVVNDILGHSIGDALLAAIGSRLEEMLPPHALLARLGGDEFVILLPSAGPAIREAIAIAEDVQDALRNPFSIEGREVSSNASIGIVRIDDSYQSAETILRDADISMYHAKRAGRAGYAVFDRTMRDRVTHQLELEGGLRGALERAEFAAHYQPIMRLSDGAVVGFEALARWDRTGGGDFVSASEFINVAEQTGMLRAIDADLFVQICRDATVMLQNDPGIRFSVNVSANDLTRASLLADIDATLQRFNLTAKNFKFEITETAVMEDAERALAMLGELRSRGFEITIDDFGVGYSSLSYLQRLPVSGVKIDRSFIVSLPVDGQAVEIARAIIALAKTLGLSVTAEGVERREQLDALIAMGVDFAQGFYYSRAVPFEAAQTFLNESRRTVV